MRKGKAQQLRRDYENIAFRDGELVEDFASLGSMVTELSTLGEHVSEQQAIEKLLRVVPHKFEQIVMSIETLLDLSELSLEDVTGRLKTVEDRKVTLASAGGKLLLTEEQWAARCKERSSGGASDSSKGGGRGKGKPKKKGKAGPRPDDQCHNCGKEGHWACDCKAPRRQGKGRQERANVAEDEKAEEPSLPLTQLCALGRTTEGESGGVV